MFRETILWKLEFHDRVYSYTLVFLVREVLRWLYFLMHGKWLQQHLTHRLMSGRGGRRGYYSSPCHSVLGQCQSSTAPTNPSSISYTWNITAPTVHFTIILFIFPLLYCQNVHYTSILPCIV